MKIIAGALKGRTLKTLTGPAGYRPAMGKVRESLFSLLEARGVIWAESIVLDLFAGSGSLAFEAVSRGAKKAYVEKHLRINTEGFEGLTLELDRNYGSTRIIIWYKE